MCGILGFIGPEDRSLALRMNETQKHRGPDDDGYYFDQDDQVTLAMRRLWIQDQAGGGQPMVSDDGLVSVVLNGEVFNAPRLRSDLERDGFAFRSSHSDTEVLLHLYRRDGQVMVNSLNGMFSFVVHDKRNHLLFGARDRAGIKPLHYSFCGKEFSFSSEVKSLLQIPGIGRDLSRQAIYDYLTFQYIPSPLSVFADIKKLPAAHSFVFDLRGQSFSSRRYWSPSFGDQLEVPEADVPRFLRGKLEESVSRWMQSDVPIGVSLSGGLDSAALVGLATQVTGKQLRTYSLGFLKDEDHDETQVASVVARKWGTEHVDIRIAECDFISELPKMIHHLDEPYAGGMPSWFVYKTMGMDVKVALTGTGGDELFGNYGKWMPYSNPGSYLRRIQHNLNQGDSFLDFVRSQRSFLFPIYLRETQKRRLFSIDFLLGVKPSEGLIDELWGGSKGESPRDSVPRVDFGTQLPDEFLFMTDRFSMAHSLEARTPFLDNELVDAVFSIPARSRTHPHNLKGLLVNSVSDLIPRQVREAPKRGFVLPQERWLRGALKPDLDRLFQPAFLQKQGVFSRSVYDEVVRPFLAGSPVGISKVWTLFMFQKWFEEGQNER